MLVVEDESTVRALVCTILRNHGYTVIEAGGGDEALRLAEKDDRHIDLLLTDVVMPQMSGVEVAERLATARPEMKVLFMSGYTDHTLVSQYGLGTDVGFIQKPLESADLIAAVQRVLADDSSAFEQQMNTTQPADEAEGEQFA